MAKRLKSKAAKSRKRSKTTRQVKTTRTVVVTKRNPSGIAELAEYAVPGLGGFVASRFVTKLAATQLAKRWPGKAKHVTAGVSVGSLLALWFLGHRWKWLAKYQMPAVVGATLATVQSLVQLYFPNKLGWILGDPGQAIGLQQAAQQIAAQPPIQALPDHLEEISDDPRYYAYNDAYDAGRHAATQKPVPTVPPVPPITDDIMPDDDRLAAGIFGGGGLGAGN